MQIVGAYPEGTNCGRCMCCEREDAGIVDHDTCFECYEHLASGELRDFLKGNVRSMDASRFVLLVSVLFNVFDGLEGAFAKYSATAAWKARAKGECSVWDLAVDSVEWRTLSGILMTDLEVFYSQRHYRRIFSRVLSTLFDKQ